MAYETFAWYYDSLNVAADYDKLIKWLLPALKKHGVENGLIVDLGCGTGEVSLRLAGAGYDVIGVDASVEMLSVFREKLSLINDNNLLLLNQDLTQLDLYGTVKAGVSLFDTLNHIEPTDIEKALTRAALFIEPGGVLIFDVNTPLKHRKILGNNSFEIELENEKIICIWQNNYDAGMKKVKICIEASENNRQIFREEFYEYDYEIDYLQSVLESAGMRLMEKCDGENFDKITSDSQRVMLVFKKALN